MVNMGTLRNGGRNLLPISEGKWEKKKLKIDS